MIGIIFEFATEMMEVRVDSNSVLFRTREFGSQFGTIDNLKLDYAGVCREFPDLENNENWKEEAINRFKEKIKSCETEKEIVKYLIKDLAKVGYIPRYIQEKAYRPKKIQ